MELIFGMALAFVLGAYIRQPWAILPPKKETPPKGPELAITPDDDEAKAELKKMEQLKNIFGYTANIGKEE